MLLLEQLEAGMGKCPNLGETTQGQIKNQGRALGQDINQLLNAGLFLQNNAKKLFE